MYTTGFTVCEYKIIIINMFVYILLHIYTEQENEVYKSQLINCPIYRSSYTVHSTMHNKSVRIAFIKLYI